MIERFFMSKYDEALARMLEKGNEAVARVQLRGNEAFEKFTGKTIEQYQQEQRQNRIPTAAELASQYHDPSLNHIKTFDDTLSLNQGKNPSNDTLTSLQIGLNNTARGVTQYGAERLTDMFSTGKIFPEFEIGGVTLNQGNNKIPVAVNTMAKKAVVGVNDFYSNKFGVNALETLKNSDSPFNRGVAKVLLGESADLNAVHDWVDNVGGFEERNQRLFDGYSNQAQQAILGTEEAIANIDTGNQFKDTWGAVKTSLSNPKYLYHMGVQSVPMMIASALTKKPLVTSAFLEGTASQEQLRQLAVEEGLDLNDKKVQQYLNQAGLSALLITYGFGHVASKVGVSNVDTLTKGSGVRSKTAGVLLDTTEEMFLAGSETGHSNAMLGKNLTDDIGKNIGQAGAIGGTVSGVFSATGLGFDATKQATQNATSKATNTIKQKLSTPHEELINPNSKKYNPTTAYANAVAELNRADTDEAKQTAQTKINEATNSVMSVLDGFDKKIVDATNQEEIDKLTHEKQSYIDTHVTPLQHTIQSVKNSETDVHSDEFYEKLIASITHRVNPVVSTDDVSKDTQNPTVHTSHGFTDTKVRSVKDINHKFRMPFHNVNKSGGNSLFSGGVVKGDTLGFMALLDGDDEIFNASVGFTSITGGRHKKTTGNSHGNGYKIDLDLKNADDVETYARIGQHIADLAKQHGYIVQVNAEKAGWGKIGKRGDVNFINGGGSHLDITVVGRVGAGQGGTVKQSSSSLAKHTGITSVKQGTSVTYTNANGTTTTKTGGTISWRNNNSGNLMYSSVQKAKQDGAIGLDTKGYAIFASEADGDKAREKVIKRNWGNLTIEAMIHKYAPADDGKTPALKGNNPAQYTTSVAKHSGLSKHLKINELNNLQMQSLLEAMKKHEGYKVGSVQGAVADTGVYNVGSPINSEQAMNQPTQTHQDELSSQALSLIRELEETNDDNTKRIQELQDELTAVQDKLANINKPEQSNQAEQTTEQEQTQSQTSSLDEQVIADVRANQLANITRRFSQIVIESDADYSKALTEINELKETGIITENEANGFMQLLDVKLRIKGNTTGEVSNQVYNGRHGNSVLETNLGIKDYATRLDLAVANNRNTDDIMANLTRFRDDHVSKANAIKEAINAFDSSPITLAPNKNNQWQVVDNPSELPANARKYTVSTGRVTQHFQAIFDEAKDLDDFTTAWQNILNGSNKKAPSEPVSSIPVTPKTPVTTPTPDTVINTPEPVQSAPVAPNTPQVQGNIGVASSHHKMNDPNGVWVGIATDSNGNWISMSALSNPDKNITGIVDGILGNPYSTKGKGTWKVANDKEAEDKYRSLFASNYNNTSFLRDYFESLRGKTLYGRVDSTEVRPLSEMLSATANMTDEQKLDYMKSLAEPQNNQAKQAIIAKNKQAKSERDKAKQSQSEQVDDSNDTEETSFYIPEDVSDEDINLLLNELSNNENNHATDVSKPVDGSPSNTNTHTADDNKSIPQEREKSSLIKDGIKVTKQALTDGTAEISKGKNKLIEVINHIPFNDDEYVIAHAILKVYPDITISFDNTDADIKGDLAKPKDILQSLVSKSTHQLLAVINDDTDDKQLLALKSELDFIMTRLNQLTDLSVKEGRIVEMLTQDYESLIGLGLRSKTFLSKIETNDKAKSNLFNTLINGIKSFFGIPNKTGVSNLYERLLDVTARAIEIQAKDTRETGKLSVLASDKQERSAEVAKPIKEQNVLKAGITQNSEANLVMVKDLVLRIRRLGMAELNRLGVKKPTAKQQEQLEHFMGFEASFKEALMTSFRTKKDGYKWQDLKQFANTGTKDNPIFDDNLMTAMSHAVYDLIITNGGASTLTKRQLRSLLGVEPDALIPNHIAKKYRNLGVSINDMTSSLGRVVIRDLGLKQTDDVPEQTLARLEASLGDWLISAMQVANMVHINTLPSGEFNQDKLIAQGKDGEILESDWLKQTHFVSLSTNELNTQIADIGKGTGSYLADLLGVQSRKVYPTLKPNKEVKDKVESTSAKLSTKQKDRLLKAQAEPIVVNQDMLSLVDNLRQQDNEFFYDLFQARVPTDEELATKHLSKHESLKESAEGNIRDIDNFFGFVDGLPSKDTPFYDSIKTAKNSRMHYMSNVVNFQTSKIHRALVELANFKVDIDLSGFDGETWFDDKGKPKPETLFLRAIFENAEGTEDIFKPILKDMGFDGFTVDKVPSGAFLPIAYEYLTSDIKVNNAVLAVRQLQAGKTLSSEQKTHIKELVDTWGMGANSFRAMMEVSNFLTAVENKTAFTTSLGLSSDGVNNGIAIASVLMGITDSKLLNMVGIFGKSSEFKSYFDTRTDPSVGDYYTGLKPILENAIEKLSFKDDYLNNAKRAFEELNTNLKERKTLKAILIPFGYGAGTPRLIQSASEQMIKDIYATMEKIANMGKPYEKKQGFVKLQSKLQTILGNGFKLPEDLLNFTFSDYQLKQLTDVYATTIGGAIKSAMTAYASEFSNRRSFNIAIHNMAYDAYEIFKAKLEREAEDERIKRVKAKYPDAKPNELERYLAYETLTPKERKEWIDDKLAKAFPTIASSYEHDEEHVGSIELAGTEKTLASDKSVDTVTTVFDGDKGGLINRTRNVLIRTIKAISTGVTANSQMIQGSDSGISSQAMTADGVISINVHDANIANILHYMRMANEQNKAFFDVTSNYHIYYESLLGLVNTIESLDTLSTDEQQQLVHKWIKALNRDGMLDLNEMIWQETDLSVVLTEVTNMLIEKAIDYDLAKISLWQEQGVVHQYAGEGGEYTLTDADYKTLQTQETMLLEAKDKLNERMLNATKSYQGRLGVIDGIHYGEDYGFKNNGKLSKKSYDISDINHPNEITDSVAYAFFVENLKLTDTSNNDQTKAKQIAQYLMDNKDKWQELIDTAMGDNTDEASKIYSKLGTKTKTDNIIIESVYGQNGVKRAREINGVFSLRTDGKYHFGNPFSSDKRLVKRDGLVQTNSVKESVERYIDWVINSSDERAVWIREILKSGKLKGKPIIYYKELGEPSHANALDYLINQYDWGNEDTADNQDTLSKQSDIILANTKSATPYSTNLFKRLVSINPDLSVGVVTEATDKQRAKDVGLKGGGVYYPDTNEAWFNLNDTDWYASPLELVNHELIHSVTYDVIASGKYNGRIKKLHDELLNLLPYLDTENDFVRDRIMYSKGNAHELLTVTLAEQQVYESLPTDVQQKLNQLFEDILGDFNESIRTTNTRRDVGDSQKLLSGSDNNQYVTRQSGVGKSTQSSDINQRNAQSDKTVHEKGIENAQKQLLTYSLFSLEEFLNNLNSKKYKGLTDFVIKAVKKHNPNIQVVKSDEVFKNEDNLVPASYDTKTNTITIYKPTFDTLSDNDKAMYINHELIHGLVEQSFSNPKLKQYVDKLEAMRLELIDVWQANQHGYPASINRRLSLMLNDHLSEFIAYGLTDPIMAKWINDNLSSHRVYSKREFVKYIQQFLKNVYHAWFGGNPSKGFGDFVKVSKHLFSDHKAGSAVRLSQVINEANDIDVVSLFTSLPRSNVSSEHNAQLDSLINTFIGGYYKHTANKSLVDLAQGKIKNKALIFGLKSSDKEAYVTEALVSVFNVYLNNNAGTLAVNGINKLYSKAQAQFKTAKDLFSDYDKVSDDEKARLRAIHQAVFNPKNKTADSLAWFMALAVSNEELGRTLSNHVVKGERSNHSWFDKFMGILEQVVNTFNNVFFHAKGRDAKSQIDAYIQALALVETKARNAHVDYIQLSYSMAYGGLRRLTDMPIRKGLVYAFNRETFIQSKFSPVRTLGKVASVTKDADDLDKVGQLIKAKQQDTAEQLINEMVDEGHANFSPNNRMGLLADSINEIIGLGKRGLNVDKLIRMTKTIEQYRQSVKDSTYKAIRKQFTRELTKEEKFGITNILLRTDMASLLNHGFKPKDVLAILDETKRKKMIAHYENKLIDKVGHKDYDMLQQVYSLAYYMATGNSKPNMIKSAHGVAIGLGSDYQTTFDKMDNEIFEMVDVLSSLIALDFKDSEEIKVIQKLSADQSKGLIATLNLHKELIQKGRTDFESNPYNYQKGYIPEMVNPYRKVVYATQDEVANYKRKGFEIINELKQDDADDTDGRVLMIHPEYQPFNYVSGTLDMVDTHHRGTPVYEKGVNDKGIREVNKAHLVIRKANAKQRPSVSSFDRTGNALIPTYDTQGAILDYHYEMGHTARDVLLERDNSFDELLATLNGGLEFKPEMFNQQKQIAKAIAQDAKQNVAKRPNEYIQLDFNSKDPDVQRVIKMIPYSFRTELQKQFGKHTKSYPIHKSMYTATFGYQAYSVVNIWDKLDNNKKLNLAENLLRGMFDLAFKQNGRKRALQAERIIQDTMTFIKDMIVIRSGGVLLGNILSNTYLLMTLGINPVRILKDMTFSWRNSKNYRTMVNRIEEVNALLMTTNSTKDKSLLNREKKQLQESLNRNPMKEYMEAGLMSTIVEDLTKPNETSYKTELQKKVDSYVDLIPKPISNAINELTIGDGSMLHNFLSEATQFSDLSAKYTLAKYLHENGTDKDKAIYEAQLSFINYDIPTNQFLDYMNRMGLMMFTKFFLRFQRVMVKLAYNAPVSSLMGHYAVEYMGGQGVYDPFWLNRLGNPLELSVFNLPNAMGEVISANVLF